MTTFAKHDKVTFLGGPYGAVQNVGDTKFLADSCNVGDGDVGYYVEPIQIAGATYHVTSTRPAGHGLKTPELPDGRAFRGPFVIVAENQFRHFHKNHVTIEGIYLGEEEADEA